MTFKGEAEQRIRKGAGSGSLLCGFRLPPNFPNPTIP